MLDFIVAKVSGLPFTEFVRKNILTPLKMKQSVFDPGHDTAKRVTAFNNNFVNDSEMLPSITGFLSSTPRDMLKWVEALHNNKIVNEASIETLFTAHSNNAQASLGRGVFNNGQLQRHSHHGSHFNLESTVNYNLKDDIITVLMTNNKNFKLDAITTAIEAILKGESYSLPRKSIYLFLRQLCYNDVDACIKEYATWEHDTADLYDFSDPSGLNRIGYKLLERKQIEDAIKVFTFATTKFPENANSYDSLAEAYYLYGDQKHAAELYMKVLVIDPSNKNAHKMLDKISSE